MMTRYCNILLFGLFLFCLNINCKNQAPANELNNNNKNVKQVKGNLSKTVRFASYNASMFREDEGQLLAELKTPDNDHIHKIAEIIQRTRPDFLAIMEFDYVSENEAALLFQKNYLDKSHNGTKPINYPYVYAVPSNTGVLGEVDMNDDGLIKLPDDAYGFGRFSGQYAFAIFSRFPFDEDNIRTFRNMLWTDMPDAKLPKKSNKENFYSKDALTAFRLSSKNHIDIPVKMPDGKIIHALVSHPTPPVFDGPEDKNGLRNHDEIKLWVDYISGADYLKDDKGRTGGLEKSAHFVVMGDLNADPLNGDSADGAIAQLLDHPAVNQQVARGNLIPKSKGAIEIHPDKKGDPAALTSFFGLRIDYVLPSRNLTAKDAAVFWPKKTDSLAYLTKDKASSDHLLVWVDLLLD